jgi:4-hydroxybenzoate polyprenyltransferase
VRAIRAYQWLKNLLVFVPLLASHQLTAVSISQAMLAFLAFSFSASSAYLINDALDLPADRLHEKKRYRPLAAGDLSLPMAVLLAFALLAVAATISLGLPGEFRLLLAGYVLITLLYSLALKRIVLVDVLTLAGLYTLRVIAGGAAVSVVPSFWLLAFSMFLFLSLALIKRSAELASHADTAHGPVRRGYGRADLDHLRTMGVASGYLSVLVVALYINSEEVLENYSFPQALWLVCPLLLYWVSRLWLKTGRGEMHHDPLIFAIRDPISQCLAALMFLAVLIAA